MMRFLCGALIVLAVSVVNAQGSPASGRSPGPVGDSLFLHAQRLVNEGRGVEGRALVDSLFRMAAPGTPAQAEALFWRATLATTAAEAERDYRQITVEHPLSPRAPDALLRLAQLELQRGDRALALAHLDRLLREHGSGAARARAAYWSARVHFELNDPVRACQSLADARAAVPSTDVELRNQIDYAVQRCPAPVAVRPTPAVPASSAPPVAPRRDTVSAEAPVRDTAMRAVRDSAPAPAALPASTGRPRAGSTTPPSTTPAAASSASAPPVPASGASQRFSVQVAAYQTRAEADRLVKKYRANGYDARTFGVVAPFRVRIGRFRTRAEAVELAKVLKAKSGAAFVVMAEPR